MCYIYGCILHIGESSNGADSEGIPDGNPETKSHEWIAEAAIGWTAANSKDMTMGCMYLLFGSPEKVRFCHCLHQTIL